MPLELTSDWVIQFQNLDFIYPGRPKASLSVQSLKIQAGEKIALVGRSGSGKTTLVKLLAGSLSTADGGLTWAGLPLNEIDPSDWERFCVYVPQVPWMGSGTVFDQIRLGQPSITDAQIGEVLESMGMSGFATSDANQLSAEGLSTGQMQMVGLARCLVRSGSLLILDEPTNSLDSESEQIVLKAIFERYNKATVILITHKKNLIGLMDRAIVMESGAVKANGAIQKNVATLS
jgi:ATP-binding cassette subfamily C protein LapB